MIDMYKKINLVLLFGILFFFSSCSDNFLDVGIHPTDYIFFGS